MKKKILDLIDDTMQLFAPRSEGDIRNDTKNVIGFVLLFLVMLSISFAAQSDY